MKERIIRLAYTGFIAVCAVIGFAAAVALRNISQAEASADWVNHVHATIYSLDRVVGSVVAGDGAARIFVLTGRSLEQTEARGEFAEAADQLETLKALTRDDAAALAQVRELETLVQQHVEATLALVEAREGKNRAGLEKGLQDDTGIDVLREIKRRAARLRADEFALLDRRDHTAYQQAQTTRWVLGICVALDFLLLAALAWMVRDDIATRNRLAVALQDANTLLEARVAERTRDLAATNARLRTENHERKWAVQSIEHQLRYNQIIVNATSDLIFVVTRTLTVTRVNPAVVHQTGWKEEDILGQPLGARLQSSADAALALYNGRELHDQPARLTDRQGRDLTGRFTLLPIHDNDKIVGGVVLVRLIITPAQS